MLQYQHVFEHAVANAASVDNQTPSNEKKAKKPNEDPNKLDYAVSKGIRTLQSRLVQQEIKNIEKAKKPYMKRGDATATFEEIQVDDSVVGVREKLVHKKWTSLDRCLQWELLKAFAESNTRFDVQTLHSLLKQGGIPASAVVYDHKEAKITELNIDVPTPANSVKHIKPKKAKPTEGIQDVADKIQG